MSKVVITHPDRHNCPFDTKHSIYVDGPLACYDDLGVCAKWLVNNVPDKAIITFKSYGPKHPTVSGKIFREIGLDVLLRSL